MSIYYANPPPPKKRKLESLYNTRQDRVKNKAYQQGCK